ncbi:MAG: hypothetical protein N2645_18410 [Clostridia bacterium]|nr:hypothetical protein [Clostridia bacterium]
MKKLVILLGMLIVLCVNVAMVCADYDYSWGIDTNYDYNFVYQFKLEDGSIKQVAINTNKKWYLSQRMLFNIERTEWMGYWKINNSVTNFDEVVSDSGIRASFSEHQEFRIIYSSYDIEDGSGNVVFPKGIEAVNDTIDILVGKGSNFAKLSENSTPNFGFLPDIKLSFPTTGIKGFELSITCDQESFEKTYQLPAYEMVDAVPASKELLIDSSKIGYKGNKVYHLLIRGLNSETNYKPTDQVIYVKNYYFSINNTKSECFITNITDNEKFEVYRPLDVRKENYPYAVDVYLDGVVVGQFEKDAGSRQIGRFTGAMYGIGTHKAKLMKRDSAVVIQEITFTLTSNVGAPNGGTLPEPGKIVPPEDYSGEKFDPLDPTTWFNPIVGPLKRLYGGIKGQVESVFTIFTSMVPFLPPEFTAMFTIGLAVVILLRIVGR